MAPEGEIIVDFRVGIVPVLKSGEPMQRPDDFLEDLRPSAPNQDMPEFHQAKECVGAIRVAFAEFGVQVVDINQRIVAKATFRHPEDRFLVVEGVAAEEREGLGMAFAAEVFERPLLVEVPDG